MSLPEQLRAWCIAVRRKPSPIADAIPMVNKAADELDRLTADYAAATHLLADRDAQIERLMAELATLRASAASVQADQRAEIDAANAALDELRVDAERFKFVQDNSEWRRYEGDERDAPYSMLCVRLPYEADLSCKAMRVAAIDAARALRKGTT